MEWGIVRFMSKKLPKSHSRWTEDTSLGVVDENGMLIPSENPQFTPEQLARLNAISKAYHEGDGAKLAELGIMPPGTGRITPI